MAVLRFDANVAQEVALKYDGGKQVQSRIPDAPDQMMYTLCGDDTIYVPLHVGESITQLGIRKMELFSICKKVQNNVTRWEVKRVGDTVTQPIEPPTMLENQLTRSIDQAKQQRQQAVTPSKSSPATVASMPIPGAPTSRTNSTSQPIHHTGYSRTLAAALIAAVDASREAERYAAAVGFAVEFNTEDIRAFAITLFISASKDPGFLSQPTQKVNGGTQWPQQ